MINSDDSDFEVELTAPATVEKVSVPAGSHVVFAGPNLKAIMVKEPWTFFDHKYPAGTRFDFSYAGYYGGTALNKVTLGGADSSGSNAFQSGDVVSFDHGIVRSAVLKGPHTFGGKSYSDGDHLTFDDLGAVRTVRSRAEADAAAAKSSRDAERASEKRQTDCRLKCGSNDSCMSHCRQYGY